MTFLTNIHCEEIKPMTTIYTYCTEVNCHGDELEAEIHFSYYGGCKGERDEWGVPMTPGDDPEVSILEVYVDGVDILEELDGDEIERIEDLILENWEPSEPDWEE